LCAAVICFIGGLAIELVGQVQSTFLWDDPVSGWMAIYFIPESLSG